MRHRNPWMRRILAGRLLLGVGACASPKPGALPPDSAAITPGGPGTPSVPLPSVQPPARAEAPSVPVADTGDLATIARLEREARAIAKVTGCGGPGACRTAPVGARGCGGPRTFVVYCAATTDTIALMRTLRELERVEKAYLAREGMASTCEMRIAPRTTLVGGSCTEASRGPGLERVP